MLPKKKRLTTEFFDKTIVGRSFHFPSLSLRITKQQDSQEATTRFAVSASKKNFKTAVLRNRARRKVYAALLPLLPSISNNFRVIILIKPEAFKLKHSELESVLRNSFSSAGIMKKPESTVK